LHAIILAGGKGTRLAPYTDSKPKPLVQINGRPVLDIIVHQLQTAGFTRLTLCVSHLGEMIQETFGDGDRYGIATDYCWDVKPLGTAAPLLRVPRWQSPALVMNADILTALDFGRIMEAHRLENAVMTVATIRHEIPVSFGVLDIRGSRIEGIKEKPQIAIDVFAGIQVIDPLVRKYIPEQEPLDMPSLIRRVIDGRNRVTAHKFSDPWHDVGTPEALWRAASDFERNPERYVPAESRLPGSAIHSMEARHAW